MKKRYLSLACATVMTLAFTSSAYSLSVTTTNDAATLVNAISGTGINIYNPSYTGYADASGTFTGGAAAGIGIESGIVLTSGLASNVDGTSNSADNITSNNGVAGYGPLDALIPGFSTYDATVLSFDFDFGTAGEVGGDAFFSFVFGSEEYNEYVGSSYNDVFGFFLDGTDVGDNVALIPGTSTPVSINNVNNDTNSSYYNDNDPSDNGTPTPFAFEYDGFTDVIQVEMLGLTAGLHTLTLAVADAGDSVLDSGVFIKGSSFSDQPSNPVPEPSTLLLFGTGLAGLARLRRKKE